MAMEACGALANEHFFFSLLFALGWSPASPPQSLAPLFFFYPFSCPTCPLFSVSNPFFLYDTMSPIGTGESGKSTVAYVLIKERSDEGSP